jgi:hypothetical protein
MNNQPFNHVVFDKAGFPLTIREELDGGDNKRPLEYIFIHYNRYGLLDLEAAQMLSDGLLRLIASYHQKTQEANELREKIGTYRPPLMPNQSRILAGGSVVRDSAPLDGPPSWAPKP